MFYQNLFNYCLLGPEVAVLESLFISYWSNKKIEKHVYVSLIITVQIHIKITPDRKTTLSRSRLANKNLHIINLLICL